MKITLLSFFIFFAQARSIYVYKDICDKLDEEDYTLTKKIMKYEFCKKNPNQKDCENNNERLQDIKLKSETKIKK